MLNSPRSYTLRILVAEDNAINQQVLAHFLSNLGYNFDMVANGLQAVEAVRSGQYGAVLMDIQMPVMDGIAATMQIRRLASPMKHIPIIAVTAHHDDFHNQRCLDAGMNDLVAKPVSVTLLNEVISRVTAQAQPHQ